MTAGVPSPSSGTYHRSNVTSPIPVDVTGYAFVASADREPAAGAAPTTGWLEGDEITDRHGLLIPAATPSGPYHLSIVLYDEATLVPAFTWSHAADVHVEPVR